MTVDLVESDEHRLTCLVTDERCHALGSQHRLLDDLPLRLLVGVKEPGVLVDEPREDPAQLAFLRTMPEDHHALRIDAFLVQKIVELHFRLPNPVEIRLSHMLFIQWAWERTSALFA